MTAWINSNIKWPAGFALSVDLNQGAHNAFGCLNRENKSQGRYPMAFYSDDDHRWICGSLEERVLVLAIIAISALAPVVMWFH